MCSTRARLAAFIDARNDLEAARSRTARRWNEPSWPLRSGRRSLRRSRARSA